MPEILEEYKFSENVVDLIGSYLTDRSYYIKSSDTVGDPIRPELERPQGGVLPPLLWSIYINPPVDTAHRKRQKIKAFVDDCQWLFKFNPNDGFPERKRFTRYLGQLNPSVRI